MNKIRLGRHTLEVYENIEELPIKRFHAFNKYLLIDAGIGSDVSDITGHVDRALAFMHQKDEDSAKTELHNLRQALYFVAEKESPKYMSFVPFIHSINGEQVHDLSDENVKKILEKLNHVKKSVFDKLVDTYKKKVEEELDQYFPKRFSDSETKEYHDLLRQKTTLLLSYILEGKKDNLSKATELEYLIVTFAKPKSFLGAKSAEILYNKQFSEMCLFIQKEAGLDPDKTTVLDLFNALEVVKKRNTPKNGSGQH